MLPPLATGLGDAASVTDISALEPTIATSVAESLVRSASPPPLIVAMFVKVAGADCATRAFSVIAGYAPPAANASERVQLTVCPEIVQVQPVPVALVGLMPNGSVSFIVTTPVVAPYGLTLETVMV